MPPETSRTAPTRIAVVGCGAVGASLGADLAQDLHHRVQFCSRQPFDEVRITWPGGTAHVAQAAATDPAAAEPADWVLLCTKAHQVEGTAPWLANLPAAGARLAVVQNGIEHRQHVAPWADRFSAVVPVIANLPAERRGNGEVVQRRTGELTVADDAHGRAFAALFANARTGVATTADFVTAQWRKLLWNAAVGGLCARELRGPELLRDARLHDTARALMREICAVARREGADLDDGCTEELLRSFVPTDSSTEDSAGECALPSIAVDRRAGRKMEWRARNDVVVRIARRHGVPVPENEKLVARLAAIDRELA